MSAARELLASLEGAGLVLKVEGERLLVSPADRLTDEQREAIRLNKAEVVAEIQWREETALDRAVKNGWSAFDDDGPVTLLTWHHEGHPPWTIAMSTAALEAADKWRASVRTIPPKVRGKRKGRRR